jgi:hypothetical protein
MDLASIVLPLPTGPEQITNDPLLATRSIPDKRGGRDGVGWIVTSLKQTAGEMSGSGGLPSWTFVNTSLWSCRGGCKRYSWIRSKAANEPTASGIIVIILFAGLVTNPRRAVVVNAVSVSSVEPLKLATMTKSTNVRIGENIPRAFAIVVR